MSPDPKRILFVHPAFPAQFAHVAGVLARRGHDVTYLSAVDTSALRLPFRHVDYSPAGEQPPVAFYNPRGLEGHLAHAALVLDAMRQLPDYRPDVVVGHMSYGTMLYLRDLYPDARFVGYFEVLPPPYWTPAAALRPDYPPSAANRLGNATYHALTHLHFGVVDALYTPTHWQRSTAPVEQRHRIEVLHDGIDCELFRRGRVSGFAKSCFLFDRHVEPPAHVVTYVSRGLESVRGFDVFMQVAKRIYREIPDVVFLVAGAERTHYGHEAATIGAMSFKNHVLMQDDYDLSKFFFMDTIPVEDLATLYALSDLHVYLTADWVLSWSLLQAMASGCTILASDTAPVREVIDSGRHGVLDDFYDVESLADDAITLLQHRHLLGHLGRNARGRVLQRYEMARCVNRLEALFFAGVPGNRHGQKTA